MYVELKNINKTFGDYKASDNVNFGIEKGKLIGLLGPSGCQRYSRKQKRHRLCIPKLRSFQIYDSF